MLTKRLLTRFFQLPSGTAPFGLWDAAWLVGLALYCLGGIALVPFHGDEAMQITMSRDYFTVLVDGQASVLPVSPPYAVDTPAWLRLINGSVNLYTLGAALQVAGYTDNDLPALWQWPLSYDENVTLGHRPDDRILTISRIPSSVFLALSGTILFAIGWQFRGRLTAFISSGLYALSPVILLNGRRAMMEGSVLCFGLLTLYCALMIGQGRTSWRWWLALSLAAGLTLASKHSGIVFVASGLGWLILRCIQTRYHTPQETITLSQTVGRLVISSALIPVVFIVCSPALWNDPLARFGELLQERQMLLESQVKAEPDAPTPMMDRITGILTQSYMRAPLYFEAAFWANAGAIQAEIAAYSPSFWSGLHTSVVVGAALTLAAVLGLIVLVRAWRTWQAGILVWAIVTAASLLVNPLPWQRYYLALYPLAALLTAIGIASIANWLSRRRSAS